MSRTRYPSGSKRSIGSAGFGVLADLVWLLWLVVRGLARGIMWVIQCLRGHNAQE